VALFVLGMHRSGTSALAHVAGALGLALPVDLMGPGLDNVEGYGESESLKTLNDAVLESLGASWHSPPAMERDWTALAESVRERARVTLLGAYPTADVDSRWVWKDPRLCILLPMWRVLFAGSSLRCLLVFRHPASIARSLVAENRGDFRLLTTDFGQALWERYTGCLLRSLNAGDEVLVTDFDRLMTDRPYREGWSRHLSALLAPEVDVGWDTALDELENRLKPGLVSHLQESEELSSEQRELYRLLQVRADDFSLAPFVGPPESERTTALLEEHRACQPGGCPHHAPPALAPVESEG